MQRAPISTLAGPGRWIVLLLALWLPSNASFAECLGCPAGALEVTVHLKNGTAEHGLIEIHSSLVESLVDVRPFPTDAATSAWPDELVRLWQRSFTSHQVFEGPSYLLRGMPGDHELMPSDGDQIAGLPLLVIEEPLRASFSEIAWIEDRSIPEGHWRLLGKPYPVDPETARMLLDTPKTAISIRDRRETEDGAILGLAFSRPVDADELARLCIEKPGFYELWSEEGIICIHWGGTT